MIMKTKNAGIDYGMGKTNVDHETGIHYGVIHQNHCAQAWCDSAEPHYPACCPKCGSDIEQEIIDNCYAGEEQTCPHCNESLEESDFQDAEPSSYVLNDGEYVAESDEYGDIFIIKSPYYTKCAYCSPCAPGAGYLTSTNKNGIKAYCFGHDFFDEKAPYPVFSVETNKRIKPE
jgi:hypothetical protein